MFITIDEADRRPIYQQVVDELKALMARGELRDGSPLPPVRQLAAHLGVNLNTIATAYRELQTEGLISIRHGSGAVVTSRNSRPDNVLEAARRSLRTVLTQLVLTGLSEAEIFELVRTELQGLIPTR
ncbi:MAG TPA: GntR family transcriptional regulator [Acidobacteriota bacterium]|nr:GntR family transcriptional regulator [Acidobacteriota bacterium]HND22112.1 GntR family transcriptional regulator [Acidobacteriota bacterium]